MNARILLTLFGVIVAQLTFSQVTTFQKMYNYTGNPYTECVATADSGYVFTGIIGSGITRPCLIKLNWAGDTLWTRRYINFGASLSIKTALLQTRDGGFVVTSPEIIKTDANGNVMWVRSNSSAWYGGDASESPNGDICAVGTTQTPSGSRISVIKLDSAGTPLANYYFGSVGDDPHAIRHAVNGGHIIAGTYELTGGGNDGLLVRLNDNGTVLWSKRYDINGDEIFYKVLSLDDGSFMAMGTGTNPLSSGNNCIILTKVDSMGTPLWSKWYVETNTYGLELFENIGKGYLITGSSNLSGNSYPGFILNVDTTGNVNWFKKYDPYPGTVDVVLCSVDKALVGGYFVNGYTSSSSGSNFYAMKTDSNGDNYNFCAQISGQLISQAMTLTTINYPFIPINGTTTVETVSITSVNTQTTPICSSVGIEETNATDFISIYPNPVIDVLFLKNPSGEPVEVSIFDITGKELIRKSIEFNGQIDVKNLSSGVYAVKVHTKKKEWYERILKIQE